MPSPVILCSPANRAPLGTCLPDLRLGQWTQPGFRSMSRSGTYWPLDRLPLDWKSTPCMPPIGFFGSMDPAAALDLEGRDLGLARAHRRAQPQYSEIFTSTSGILPGGVLPPGRRAGFGLDQVSDLPSFRPPGSGPALHARRGRCAAPCPCTAGHAADARGRVDEPVLGAAAHAL